MMTEDIPHDSNGGVSLPQAQERLVKSCPTSANGSDNPNPTLDIKVNLPIHADD